jgi:multiple sugar transport system permease protein
VAIVTFINCWNEFIFALILISKPHMRTIPAGIALYPGEYSFPWETISAAAVVATLPIIFFIVFFQKKIISGLTRGAVKG